MTRCFAERDPVSGAGVFSSPVPARLWSVSAGVSQTFKMLTVRFVLHGALNNTGNQSCDQFTKLIHILMLLSQ